MSGLLKGNFEVRNKPESAENAEGTSSLEDRFEREVLGRLGGSVCFVSKQKVQWDVAGVSTTSEKKAAP
jgi:hypothetical protein